MHLKQIGGFFPALYLILPLSLSLGETGLRLCVIEVE